jgi:cadmium resistance transport/sequestration family protein
MESVAAQALTAAIAFAATNIDDLVVLTFFYAQVGPRLRGWHIICGQYLGFAALVALSLAGYFGALVVPLEWIGLLGLVPIALGVRAFLRRHEPADDAPPAGMAGRPVLGVAAVTFANGGDNIGIYTPLFAASKLQALTVTLTVFFCLLGLWCWLGARLARQPALAHAVVRHGDRAIPLVLVCLGFYVLVTCGTLSLPGI